MSSAGKTENQAESAQRDEVDERAEHAANAQWLKDNPIAMPQVGAGRWAVYNRAGRLCGYLVGGGLTRDTRFKAITVADEWMPPGNAPGSHGITLHDAGAYLLDTGAPGIS